MRGNINKSPIKLNAAKNKLTWWFVYEWGKSTWQKPHQVILGSPLMRIHYYQNKRLQVKESQYLTPTYSWTPYPNTQLDLLCNDNLSFQCMAPSTWLTNCADHSIRLTNYADPNMRLNHQLEKNVGYKFL